MKKRVKVGILVDNNNVDFFSFEIIKWLVKNNKRYSIYFLNQNIPKKNLFKKLFKVIFNLNVFYLINTMFFKFLIFFEKNFVLNKFFLNFIKKKYNINVFNKKILKLNPKKNNSKYFLEFDDKSISIIKELNLDIMIRLGSKILKGEILKSSKKGIISFHHGDNKLFRGGPAGFWETYFSINNSGFIIQQLTNKLDAGNIIFRGSFRTEPYFLKNQINIRFRSNYYLKKILDHYCKSRKFYFLNNHKVSNKIYKNPNFLQIINYLIKIIFRKLFIIKKINRWNIALFKGNFNKIDHSKSIIGPKSKKYFLADPFLYKYKKDYYVFVEKFAISEKKGKIVVFKLTKNSLNEVGTAINEKFHLSFPFVFKYKSKIYLIPDSSSNRDLRVYVAEKFPLKWRLYKIIFKNVNATDTLIYKSNISWNMITNLNPNNTEDLNSELYLFNSRDPINKNWKPFKNNPILVDALKARNGGIIKQNNNIHRVYQKHKFNDYGNSIGIDQLITKKKNFEIKNKKNYQLKFLKQLKKCHHLNSDGKFTVYDYI